MKRTLTLLGMTFLLTLSLAACGGDDRPAVQEDTDRPAVQEGRSPQSRQTPDGKGPIRRGAEDVRDEVQKGGDAVQDGLRKGVEDVREGAEELVDPQHQTRGTVGSSYDQMTRNARVHDRDGDLDDHENAVTPGSDQIG